MGIFDFFKKKETSLEVQKQELQSTETRAKITSYNVNEDRINFRLAGTNFCTEDEIKRINRLEYAESIQLIPEPENPYDANAIRVETMDGYKIGYIPKDITFELRDSDGKLKAMRPIFTQKSEHDKPFVTIYIEFI